MRGSGSTALEVDRLARSGLNRENSFRVLVVPCPVLGYRSSGVSSVSVLSTLGLRFDVFDLGRGNLFCGRQFLSVVV